MNLTRTLTTAALTLTLAAGAATPATAATPAPTYKKILDHHQKTHWVGNTLIVGRYSDALATCRDGRWSTKATSPACISDAYTWARRTNQPTTGIGPTTLPKQPTR